MAHECPDCGMQCYCGGDCDDCCNNFPEDVEACRHCPEDGGDEVEIDEVEG